VSPFKRYGVAQHVYGRDQLLVGDRFDTRPEAAEFASSLGRRLAGAVEIVKFRDGAWHKSFK